MKQALLRSSLAYGLLLGAGGCCFLNGSRNESPPFIGADKWWDEQLTACDPDFLVVLCDVSETHRRNNTTATFNSFKMGGMTMAGMVNFQTHFPVPIPDTAMLTARRVLLGRKTDGDHSRYSRACWTWSGGRNCSAEMAESIWQQAERKFGLDNDAGKKERPPSVPAVLEAGVKNSKD